jgi:hypothetical protein
MRSLHPSLYRDPENPPLSPSPHHTTPHHPPTARALAPPAHHRRQTGNMISKEGGRACGALMFSFAEGVSSQGPLLEGNCNAAQKARCAAT